MNIEHINQIGQTALVWFGLAASVWGLWKASAHINAATAGKKASTAERILWLLTRAADEAVAATEQEWAKKLLPGEIYADAPVEEVRAEKLVASTERLQPLLPAGMVPDPPQVITVVEAAMRRMNDAKANVGRAAP